MLVAGFPVSGPANYNLETQSQPQIFSTAIIVGHGCLRSVSVPNIFHSWMFSGQSRVVKGHIYGHLTAAWSPACTINYTDFNWFQVCSRLASLPTKSGLGLRTVLS